MTVVETCGRFVGVGYGWVSSIGGDDIASAMRVDILTDTRVDLISLN